MDANEFAETIKAKYPEYKDKDNLELAKAVVEKHPEYASKVTFDAPKAEASPKFYEIEKQQGLPTSKEAPQSGMLDAAMAAGKPLLKQIGKQFKEGATSPMPGSLLSVPIKAMSETASQAGADVARGTQHALGTGLARAAGFGTAAALDPLSYFGGGLMKGPSPVKSLAQAEMKPGVEEILNNLKEQNAPLKGIIEEQTQKVMNTVESTLKKYGDELNTAKKEIGIPTTNAEREANIVAHGNPHGLSNKNINKMYQDMIAPTKDPAALAKNVAKFKQVAGDITDPSMKVRIASTLQDNINSIVDWTKSGTTTEGVLKSQYKDLQHLAIPDSLKASKSKMAEVLDLTGDLAKKVDEPGKAEAFLRNIVTGKSARNKDHLLAIRHLETLSGEKLFDKIAQAVQTEKATEAAIKQFEKLKPAEKKAMEESGISLTDILTHKITGWTSVVKDIIKAKGSIKGPAKKVGAALGRQGLIGTSKGFALSDDNKSKLSEMLNRLKNK